MTSERATPSTPASGGIFATTHWTVVLAAGRRSTPEADRALEELCRPTGIPSMPTSAAGATRRRTRRT